MKLREIASKLGCVLKAPGPDGAASENAGEKEIRGVAGLEMAGPDEIAFLANSKYAPKVRETRAGAIIVNEKFFQHLKGDAPLPCLISANPYLDFARAVGLFYQAPRPAAGIHATAAIAAMRDRRERVVRTIRGGRRACGDRAKRRAASARDDIRRRRDRRRFPGAFPGRVREYCRIGNRVILQNGVVMGGDGFGFAKRADGTHYKIPQSGPTIVEDDVEIQSLTSIDRATVGETRVKPRRQDRQPGAGGTRLRGGRRQYHLFANRTRRQQHIGEERSAGGPGGHFGTSDDPRRRHRLRPERRWRRRRDRGGDFRARRRSTRATGCAR